MKLTVVNNGDHACLVWRPDGAPDTWVPIPGCLGFALQRRLTAGGQTTTTWLKNHVGFTKDQPPPPAGSEWQWPIQRYLWWDYDVNDGDAVDYRVIPVMGTAANPQLTPTGAEDGWGPALPVSNAFSPHISAFFNRGVIATQWVERALKALAPDGSPRTTLTNAIKDTQSPLRRELSGELRTNLLDLLATAPGDVYAALYELNDPEVLAGVTALGPKINLILANGAFKPPTNDENQKVRTDLKAAGLKIYDRLVTGSHFAHNKFFVFCDAAGKPEKVFTGSTNCTVTGLCTQVNNGLLVVDDGLAEAFKTEWDRLKAAGSDYPATLAAANSTPQTFNVDGARVSLWFAPTQNTVDLAQARKLINAAQDGVLFLFFNHGAFQKDPADWTLLQTIVNRHAAADGNADADPSLYIRGVVNQEIGGLTEAPPAHQGMDPSAPNSPVALFNGAKTPPTHLDKGVLVPAAITKTYANWETELKGASNVMIHSKVVVLDPFGANPVVMTGSHNLGTKASRANDDNLVIIEGHPALAQAYAANIIAIFQEYRWRDYVAHHQSDPTAWKGLQDGDAWQQGHLSHDSDELMFWAK
jgi:phosphatidylserine/phosphatidylglycerophosphate/cardiolipin synthase-like enzyme